MVKARAIVSQFTESSQKADRLNQFCILCKLTCCTVKQDVCTRWWSTFILTERLLKLKDPLMMMKDSRQDQVIVFTYEEWENLSIINAVLEPFMAAQKFFEADSYVTISCIPRLVMECKPQSKRILIMLL